MRPSTHYVRSGQGLNQRWLALSERSESNGGARRDRTDDLLNANQALSQLSYGPLDVKTGDRRLQGQPASLFRSRNDAICGVVHPVIVVAAGYPTAQPHGSEAFILFVHHNPTTHRMCIGVMTNSP